MEPCNGCFETDMPDLPMKLRQYVHITIISQCSICEIDETMETYTQKNKISEEEKQDKIAVYAFYPIFEIFIRFSGKPTYYPAFVDSFLGYFLCVVSAIYSPLHFAVLPICEYQFHG